MFAVVPLLGLVKTARRAVSDVPPERLYVAGLRQPPDFYVRRLSGPNIRRHQTATSALPAQPHVLYVFSL